MQELAQDINRLVRRAYPQATSDLRDQIAKDCFIDSLNEHELEWFVYQGKPKSVDEATQLALEYEAFQAGRKRQVTVRQCSKGDNPDLDPLTKLINRLEKMENELEGMKRQNKGNNLTCNFCGKTGHFRRRSPNLMHQKTIHLIDTITTDRGVKIMVPQDPSTSSQLMVRETISN